MTEFTLTVKQEINKACDEVLNEIAQQERKTEETISELVVRKADLVRKREVFTSIMKRGQRKNDTPSASPQPRHEGRSWHRTTSPQSTSSLDRNDSAALEDQFSRRLADNPEESAQIQSQVYKLLTPSASKRKLDSRIEQRYRAILGEIADQVTNEVELTPETDLPLPVSTSLPAFEPHSRFPRFPKARGDIYVGYRLSSGNRTDFEKSPRWNEYFTRHPVLPCESRPQPVIYVLDLEWFLKTFFDEIRHIESCVKYQAANWKKFQAQIVMNESQRVLIQLIDEILNAYSPTLQVSPARQSRAGTLSRVNVRDSKGVTQEVDVKRLSRKGERLFLGRTEVTFAGYVKQDINVILPVPTFDVMNPHILKLMRHELMEHRYEQAVEYWRACELRIQELGTHYENGLLGQLQTWFA